MSMLGNYKIYTKADVLKVAHHGNKNSSTQEFLNVVQPTYAVISVGKEKSYGHPHAEVLEWLEKTGADVLRTDELGTIVIRNDGTCVSPSV